MDRPHIPVLLSESVDLLNVRDGLTYVDCTLGRAGHAKEIAKRIPNGRLIVFDLDLEAIEYGKKALGGEKAHIDFVHGSFASIRQSLSALGVDKVDGIFADLGVSSPQFDDASRGFSYREDARLDMRMDQTQELDAYKLVNAYPAGEIARILKVYGEERDAYRIAKEIERRRVISPIETTFDLVECVKSAKSPKELSKKGHPAKQTFQAIRIAVNREEEALERLLEEGPGLLNPLGRMAVITFMSLDDRLVKLRFRDLCVSEGSRHLPTPEQEKPYELLTPHPITPSEEELSENRRSASAKLRGIERKAQ
ncbi:MAG: 16S rRNA (cytosine(1402)-N(4))-methyltransferase RsmH [Firmicutes bacterium]|uniref:Ribosomal RNA small subunit methyltransferase H n=1 Tax=Candidatus Alloenteromonas pullistercoris TaxID=2840785 RepID=A0A9D9GVC9_9FIRM|nr:16S rRNA (cytosine(1402)-N(4))-methyltransferase RsmH [Candidatus Enteromonas pullistercoris]